LVLRKALACASGWCNFPRTYETLYSGCCSRDTPEFQVVNALFLGVTCAAVGWRQPWFALALLGATFRQMPLTPRMAKAAGVKVVVPRPARVRLAPMV
jgi:hypothetical protein